VEPGFCDRAGLRAFHLGRVPHCKVDLKKVHETIDCVVPLCLAIQARSLHWNGCIHACHCWVGRRSSCVICKAMSGDLCASFVIRSSTGKYFVQVFVVQERLLCKVCSTQDGFCWQGTKMSRERDAKRKS
jgi:hypothetical protein